MLKAQDQTANQMKDNSKSVRLEKHQKHSLQVEKRKEQQTEVEI